MQHAVSYLNTVVKAVIKRLNPYHCQPVSFIRKYECKIFKIQFLQANDLRFIVCARLRGIKYNLSLRTACVSAIIL